MRPIIPLHIRFWQKVNKTATCWLWNAGIDKDGYGHISVNGDKTRAHRVSWNLRYPDIHLTPDMLVCHTCDVPACINPEHLYIGTQAINMRDKVKKNRQAFGKRNGKHTHSHLIVRGDRHHNAKLTDSKVRKMRYLYASGCYSYTELGIKFNVNCQTARSAILGQTWGHVK